MAKAKKKTVKKKTVKRKAPKKTKAAGKVKPPVGSPSVALVPGEETLTEQERKYVIYFFVFGVARKAALQAGYSQTTAHSSAPNWIGRSRLQSTKPAMFDAYNHFKQEMINDYKVKAGQLIQEYCKLGFSDVGNFLKFDEENGVVMIDHEALAGKDTSCISEITQEEIRQGGARDDPRYLIRTKIKMHNKVAALDGLCKMLGLQLLKLDTNDPRAIPVGGTPYTGMTKGMDDSEATQLYLSIMQKKDNEGIVDV